MDFESKKTVIDRVFLGFLMFFQQNMIFLDFIESIRLLGDRRVSQVTQFDQMTFQTGVSLVMIIPLRLTPDLSVP